MKFSVLRLFLMMGIFGFIVLGNFQIILFVMVGSFGFGVIGMLMCLQFVQLKYGVLGFVVLMFLRIYNQRFMCGIWWG